MTEIKPIAGAATAADVDNEPWGPAGAQPVGATGDDNPVAIAAGRGSCRHHRRPTYVAGSQTVQGADSLPSTSQRKHLFQVRALDKIGAGILSRHPQAAFRVSTFRPEARIEVSNGALSTMSC